MGKTNTVNKDKAHYRVMVVLSFFLTFFTFLFVCAGVIQFTVLNPVYFKGVAKSSGFIEECHNVLTETFTSYGLASNFEAEVFEDFVSEERISQTMQQGIDYLYGAGSAVDYTAYEQELYEHLIENVKERNIEVTAQIETGVQGLAQSCRMDYQGYTAIPFLEFAIRGMEMAKAPMTMVLVVLAVVVALMLIFMWLISRRTERFVPYLIDVFVSIAILGVLLPVLGLSQKIFERVNISPETVRVLLIGYGNGIMQAFFPVAVVFALIAVGLGVVLKLKKQKAK